MQSEMKWMFLLISSCILSLVSPFQSEDSFCCRYAAFNDDCHDTCLQLFKAVDPVFLSKLNHYLPINCPRSSKRLENFWNCLESVDNATGAWYGNECCELAMNDECRTTCLKSKNKAEILEDCRPDLEESLYECVFKQQSRQKCCSSRTGSGAVCRRKCGLLFRSESGPTSEDLSRMSLTCDNSMVQCVRSYVDTVWAKSAESIKCCRHASNQHCQEACARILRTEVKEDEMIKRLRNACGEIVPHEPMWKCFLANPTPSPRSGPFVAKSQCCARAIFPHCKELCLKLFGSPWSEPSLWKQFERQCQQSIDEIELHQCLEEVNEPCTIGCGNLSFCTNFNNRPTSLFRSCNVQADTLARDQFNAWASGVIRLPSVEIPVKNIFQCEPESWKAVACSLQIKPCSTKLGKTIICHSDCLSLLNNCADKDKLQSNLKIEELCASFSPLHLQENCVSLTKFERPSTISQAYSAVTQPCQPNPCKDGQVCVINRRKCKTCSTHRCLPGCKMGHGSDFVIGQGTLVRVPDSSREEGCFKSCICSASGTLRPCVKLPCTDEHKNCKLAGQMKAHSSDFLIECNFCSCLSGNVTCTKRQCPGSMEKKKIYTGLPCNCPLLYLPVCGRNGRTYPSACIAFCLGQSKNSISPGSCLAKDPCNPNPCEEEEDRCVPTPRTCLTDVESCPQHECIPPYHKCQRLLKSAIHLMEGKAYNQHHYSEQKDIGSSSYFFSAIALLANDSGLCDARNRRFGNVCKLTRSKHRKLAYAGRCKNFCKDTVSEPVCGQDHVTYAHSCMARANGVLVDYVGICKVHNRKTAKAGKSGSACADIKCPPLPHNDCDAVLPPGSCCPVCGGLLRVLISQSHLKAIQASGTLWNGPVTVRAILWSLRRQLHVSECQAYGYLTSEGDMAVIVASTKKRSSLVQLKACTKEAERLFNLINSRSPLVTSYLVLSPLTAATLTPSKPSGVDRVATPNWMIITLLSLHAFIGSCVT